MTRLGILAAFVLWCASVLPAAGADAPAPVSDLARLPVKELTVFKDGHAFVLHQGTMPTDAAGHVVLDYLPAPVIGTFWPYSADKAAKLQAVTAGRRTVRVERTALTLRELLEANVGADVLVTEPNLPPYPATVVAFPTRSAEELQATSPANAGEQLPQKSNLVLLKTAEGTKVVAFERIQDVKFLGKYRTTLAQEEFRNLLTLQLDWPDGKRGKTAAVGMAYLQRGVRWIPGYRVELQANGKALVKLQATLLNELTDLDTVTVHLVVGVPSFPFKDTTDPVALGQVVAQLSAHFDPHAQTAHAFTNAMMTQTPRMAGRPVAARAALADLGPDVIGTTKNEDLFIYTVKNVTLKKGQRLVLPVSQYTLDYKDVYTLDLPMTPPVEYRRQGGDAQQAELARLLNAPKVTHKVRLVNTSDQPLTTAPALIVRNNRLLAQNMMTYTARGASTDLAVTTAVDIQVKKSEKETKRTPNAAAWNGDSYWRVDLSGSVHLTNYRAQAIEVEVTRYVLGNVGEADHEGKAEMVNLLEEDGTTPAEWRPYWWGWYSWPGWWHHFNGIGRIRWQVKLEPGKGTDLGYQWHYYWR